MLKIGEFSKLSRVSVRCCSHYDEIGLLPPASIVPPPAIVITARTSCLWLGGSRALRV